MPEEAGIADRVTSGQVVVYVGATGCSTEFHLHLMVWCTDDR